MQLQTDKNKTGTIKNTWQEKKKLGGLDKVLQRRSDISSLVALRLPEVVCVHAWRLTVRPPRHRDPSSLENPR